MLNCYLSIPVCDAFKYLPIVSPYTALPILRDAVPILHLLDCIACNLPVKSADKVCKLLPRQFLAVIGTFPYMTLHTSNRLVFLLTDIRLLFADAVKLSCEVCILLAPLPAKLVLVTCKAHVCTRGRVWEQHVTCPAVRQ